MAGFIAGFILPCVFMLIIAAIAIIWPAVAPLQHVPTLRLAAPSITVLPGAV